MSLPILWRICSCLRNSKKNMLACLILALNSSLFLRSIWGMGWKMAIVVDGSNGHGANYSPPLEISYHWGLNLKMPLQKNFQTHAQTITVNVTYSQCRKFIIFLSLRLYVKSILGILEVQNWLL